MNSVKVVVSTHPLIAKLEKPLLLEEKTGCRNISVFGGFQQFALNWISDCNTKMIELGYEQSAIQPILQSLKELFSGYDKTPIIIRMEHIQETQKLLRTLEGMFNHYSKEPPKSIPANTISAHHVQTAPKPHHIETSRTLVQYAKGVGPAIAKKLNRLKIQTIEDLYYHFPRRYEDRRSLKLLREVKDNEWETIQGVIGKTTEIRPRPRMTITKTAISDGPNTAYLIWFNQPFRKNFLKPGDSVIIHGKIEVRFKEIQIHNPEIEIVGKDSEIHVNRIVPIYPLTEHLSQLTLRKIIFEAIERYDCNVREIIPDVLRNSLNLLHIKEAIRQIHFPINMELHQHARFRLVFEEFFILQILLALKKLNAASHTQPVINNGISFSISSSLISEFEATLPFSLTEAQKKVMKEILEDMNKDATMHRLIQGDVGSGKTVVAAFAVLTAIKAGYQAAIMAPTEILAEQHAIVLQNILLPFGVPVKTLIGGGKSKEKQTVLTGLAKGDISLIVGTHALIQEDVAFAKLGLIVIDEQHKFGVLQRASLREKGLTPDILVMTATPIPRTLAVTLYGDLDISVIDELPEGREDIKSFWVGKSLAERVYKFIRKEIESGRQAFIVCPLIEESEKIKVASAVEEANHLSSNVFPDIPVALLHGRMKTDEKESIMKQFKDGKFKILISTTVIEVGVDCPNTTVMVVQNADRFGLAQLHQLRGRVGRGNHQSYCIFIADPHTDEGRERMRIICRHKSGFDVAEEDLELRGPGELYGTKQHGLPDLRIADLVRDAKILELARKVAFQLVETDPQLEKPEHHNLRAVIKEKYNDAQVLN